MVAYSLIIGTGDGKCSQQLKSPKARPSPPKAAANRMTPATFAAWRKRLGLTQKQAADALGCSLRSISNYEGGHWPIPLAIELACEGLSWRGKKKPKIRA
jgi:DNA-binding XRE family transcriptional regulator